MALVQVYVCSDWAKAEHLWNQFKCMTVQIEPRLNIYGINSNVYLYKFISFLTKLVIRIMKAEVSEKMWILWCKSKWWEQYSLGHYLKTISL